MLRLPLQLNEPASRSSRIHNRVVDDLHLPRRHVNSNGNLSISQGTPGRHPRDHVVHYCHGCCGSAIETSDADPCVVRNLTTSAIQDVVPLNEAAIRTYNDAEYASPAAGIIQIIPTDDDIVRQNLNPAADQIFGEVGGENLVILHNHTTWYANAGPPIDV